VTRTQLSDLWAALDALGATVHRRPLTHLSARTLAILCARETERLRVLTSPEADHIVTARRRKGTA
jgi:hypothetical protein